MGTGAAAARPRPRLRAMGGATRGLAVPIGSVIFAFVVGGLIVLVSGTNPIDAYTALLCGGIGVGCSQGENSALQISHTIVFSIPLITTGVAVALPFRAGLFNIGAEGQMLAGSIACTIV